MIIDERNMDFNFYGDPNGLKLWTDLRTAVRKYNSSLPIKSDNRIPIENSILDIDREKLGSYSNLFFLNSITINPAKKISNIGMVILKNPFVIFAFSIARKPTKTNSCKKMFTLNENKYNCKKSTITITLVYNFVAFIFI